MKGRKPTLLFTALILICSLCSCERSLPRQTQAKKVFIMYSCGHNNLSGELQTDINEICESAPYDAYSSAYRILIFNHKAKGSDYSIPTEPVLFEVHKDKYGNIVRDTLVRYQAKTYDENGVPSESGYTGADPNTLREVLTYIKSKYPADEYGLLFSSHGTGWLPYNYYATSTMSNTGKYSVGADYSGHGTMGVPSEIDVKDFAKAIQLCGIRFKYMIFDACFMGGIETAYELEGLTDYIMASPTEIMSGGFGYKNMINSLMMAEGPDLKGMCEAYMGMYNIATVTLVDTRNLETLAGVCKMFFEKYRTQIDQVDEQSVQGFFRRESMSPSKEKHWFYDLEDIFVKSGISDEDRAVLNAALTSCILYKNATNKLFDGTECKAFCGLSMFLPNVCGTEQEDLLEYYKAFRWNISTSLVK